MRFFVSGKIGDEEDTNLAMEMLRRAGHTITFDWTTIEHLKPYDQNIAASREAALLEVRGVLEADALVLIAHESGVGMYVELGIALASGRPVFIITKQPSRSMFFYHPLVTKLTSLEDLLNRLGYNRS